jgi:hypothetical protein
VPIITQGIILVVESAGLFPLTPGTIIAGGVYAVRYDGTSFQLISPTSNFVTNEVHIAPVTGNDIEITNTGTGLINFTTNAVNSVSISDEGLSILGNLQISGEATLDGVKFDSFPPGTRLLFQQSTAPTGWVTDNSLDNRSLYIKSSAPAGSTAASGGGWYGGFDNAIINNKIIDHTHYVNINSGAMSANAIHSHNIPQLFTWNGTPGGTQTSAVRQVSFTPSGDTNVDHTHNVQGWANYLSQNNANGVALGAWQPYYVTAVIGIKELPPP